MAIADRDYMKEPEEAPAKAPWLQKLNAFGERHAKLIIFLSTALIIVTVLIVANALWHRAWIKRGQAEIARALTSAELERVRSEYGKSDVLLPKILYRLGNKYNEEQQLSSAEETYQEFMKKFPHNQLIMEVAKAQVILKQNRAFLENDREALRKAPTLRTHPLRRVDRKDHPVRFGPIPEPGPVISIEMPDNVVFTADLFEDEMPNTVANFVELCKANYFDNLKFRKDGKRLYIENKTDDRATHRIAYEESAEEAVIGMLVMARAKEDSPNPGAEFFLLLEKDPELTGHTIFGRVRPEDHPKLRGITEQQAVVVMKVESSRDHEYKAVKIKP